MTEPFLSVPVSEAVVMPSAGPQGPFFRLSKEAELLPEDVSILDSCKYCDMELGNVGNFHKKYDYKEHLHK